MIYYDANTIKSKKMTKREKIKKCKVEIDTYNACIRNININDEVTKCDPFLNQITLCFEKQDLKKICINDI